MYLVECLPILKACNTMIPEGTSHEGQEGSED